MKAVRETGEPDEFDYQFMLTQLAGYEGAPDREFFTFRLESHRKENSPAPTVHIYDAHYSDLSKPANSVVGFFFAFYQLLFHLASLGLQAVYWAEAENGDVNKRFGRWRVLSSLHAIAIRLLIMFIPLLNLVLLAIGIVAFADKFSSHASWWAGIILAGLLGLGAVLFLRKAPGVLRRPILWSLTLGLSVAAGIVGLAFTAFLCNRYLADIHIAKWLLILDWLLLAFVAIFLVSRQLQQMRPGAKWLGPLLYAANVFYFVLRCLPLAKSAQPNEAATAVFISIHMIFSELAACWIISLIAAIGSWLVGEYSVGRLRNAQAKCRARSAVRTGRFAFALSASFFLIFTLALWSGIVGYTSRKFNVFDHVSPGAPINNRNATFPRRLLIPSPLELGSQIAQLVPPPEPPPIMGAKEVACPKEATKDCPHPWE